MAAPNGTQWGAEVYGNGESGRAGRIGLYITTSNNSDNTTTAVTVQVWFWSKYGVSDTGNNLYLDWSSTSATTYKKSCNIQTSSSSGSGWSTSNQILIGTFTSADDDGGDYSRFTSKRHINVSAKLSGVERVAATMYVTASFEVPALDSYTIKYNANGGSGSYADVIKYYGNDITVASAPNRSGYLFGGWKATNGTVYQPGSNYKANANTTLTAQWTVGTYTIEYHPNGGIGAPSKQTKNHGDTNFTLSTDIPTKTNYRFLGWSTTQNATFATYTAGGKYTANADVLLYAVWALDYTKPRIDSFSIYRCDTDGSPNDSGTCVYIKAEWETDRDVTHVTIGWSGPNSGENEVGGEGTSGFINGVYGDDLLSADSTYEIWVYVSDDVDDNYSTKKTLILSSSKFVIDFKGSSAGGVAIGKASELDGVFDVNYPNYFRKTTQQIGNHYTLSSPGIASSTGYVLIATIEMTAVNADTPITFVLSRRQEETPMTIHVRFKNAGTVAATIASAKYEGSNYDAYLHSPNANESGAGTIWNLYVHKGSALDTITLQDWWTSKTMESRVLITFPGTLQTELLSPFYRVTPAVLKSIVDCMMPVGYVLILWSHADPNNMYPGTTWERVKNAFLWGCDENGTIGQTGGEKTHTLTTQEIPSHTHGAVYTGTEAYASGALAEQKYAWYTTTGDAVAYGYTYAGGGAAHNNMPPYVQVSIWRRTA